LNNHNKSHVALLLELFLQVNIYPAALKNMAVERFLHARQLQYDKWSVNLIHLHIPSASHIHTFQLSFSFLASFNIMEFSACGISSASWSLFTAILSSCISFFFCLIPLKAVDFYLHAFISSTACSIFTSCVGMLAFCVHSKLSRILSVISCAYCNFSHLISYFVSSERGVKIT
jgi:hypothetical protein